MANVNKIGILHWLMVYLLWVVIILLFLAAILILRSAIQQWFAILLISRWIAWGVNQVFTVFGGIGWIIAIFTIEGYFRTGLRKGDLRPRIKRVFRYVGIILAIALLSWGSFEIYARWLT
jgi:hypothetical protein